VDADRVVNNVDIRETDAAPPPRFSLDMLRNGDGIQIIGLVPGANGGEEVAEAIEAIADGAEVTDMVETADFPPPDTWISALGYGLRALRELPRSKVTVYADRVEVEAISDSAEQQADFWRSCSEDSRQGSRSCSTSPRRVRSSRRSSCARFSMRRGFASTIAPPIRRARRSASSPPRGAAVPRERSTAPSASACRAPVGPAAVDTGLAALVELGGGTLSFSDATVTLIAAQGTEQDEFDRVIGELDADLPEVFTLDGVLPEATDARRGPARFFATLDPEDGVRLRGRLPDGCGRCIGRGLRRVALRARAHRSRDALGRGPAAGLVGARHGGSARAVGAPRGADDA
jgi:OOP family OmpA-OmpF porin